MPSKTDFNVSPYFDDYSEDKKFHRVMYRPAFAVQARELTTQQSITQDQIEKMGDHLFKHGAMVIPGQITPDFHYNAVKLTSFTGTLANFDNNTLTGGTSGIVADVIDFVATDGHRLVKITRQNETNIGQGYIIPKKYLNIVIQLYDIEHPWKDCITIFFI